MSPLIFNFRLASGKDITCYPLVSIDFRQVFISFIWSYIYIHPQISSTTCYPEKKIWLWWEVLSVQRRFLHEPGKQFEHQKGFLRFMWAKARRSRDILCQSHTWASLHFRLFSVKLKKNLGLIIQWAAWRSLALYQYNFSASMIKILWSLLRSYRNLFANWSSTNKKQRLHFMSSIIGVSVTTKM